KTVMKDLLGKPVDVLCVKGSGRDMAVLEPPGLPAVRLHPLQELIALKNLSDEEMVNVQRINLLDSSSPNPSVQTLCHASLPPMFIVHTLADAVIAISKQPNGRAICERLFGRKLIILDDRCSGIVLAKKAAEAFRMQPDAHSLRLLKDGIFTL